MGSSLKFYIKTVPGERVEADVSLPPEDGGVLTGTVVRADGEPAPGAVVLALDAATMEPVCHGLTDAHGFFLLGPLPAALYQVQVYDGASPVRAVQIAL